MLDKKRDGVIVKGEVERAKFKAYLESIGWSFDGTSPNRSEAGNAFRIWILGGDDWKAFQFTGPESLEFEYKRFSGHDKNNDWIRYSESETIALWKRLGVV